MSDTAKKIEAGLNEIAADPEKFHREMIADLVKKHGQEWVDAHMKEIESQWEYAKQFFGF